MPSAEKAMMISTHEVIATVISRIAPPFVREYGTPKESRSHCPRLKYPQMLPGMYLGRNESV